MIVGKGSYLKKTWGVKSPAFSSDALQLVGNSNISSFRPLPFLESHTVRRCLIFSGGRCCPSGLWFKKALVERVDISFRLKILLEFRIQGKGFCPELSEFAQSFQPNPCDKCNIKAAALDCEVVQ